jgi:hypothetical protein
VEFDQALITRTEELVVHLKDSCSLTNDTTVNHSLIVLFNSSCMVKDNNLCIKILSALRACLFIEEYHTLPEMCTLHLEFLNVK